MNDELAAVKDPSSYSLLTYAWVLLMSAWGGMVQLLQALRDKPTDLRAALYTIAIGLLTSTFVGVVTFWLCEWAKFEPLLTAICVAITGHAGAEAVKWFRSFVKGKLFNGVDINPD